MFITFDDVSEKILNGGVFHVAGTEDLLRKLPRGNWIGGSTEYFMTDGGGMVASDMLFVTEFDCLDFNITSYDETTISNIAADAYDSGYSIAIIPFESGTHRAYAQNASHYDGMFIKNIVGWISGLNLGKTDQVPIAVNGLTGEASRSDAAVLHIRVPEEKTVQIGIVNIFSQDESTPVIEFDTEGFSAVNCRVDGAETSFADYIAKNKIDTNLPIVGEYSGAGVNISFKAIENGTVNFYAPVFKGIQYRIAKPIVNYAEEFSSKLRDLKNIEPSFSCNCILNFLYGGLEGKKIDAFFGPITFGEIAYQLVNQTLVYVSVLD